MITSLQIGPNGRLGNQMFQYAAMVGLSTIKGYEWKLHNNDEVKLWDAFELKNAKLLKENEISNLKFRYNEPSFYFNTSIFLQKDDTDLYGYYQSPLYFIHCIDLIRSEFKFKDHIMQEALNKYDLTGDKKRTCSIHVRRTDYLEKKDYHPACSLEYYEKAKSIVLNSTKNNVRFLLFGDDHDWISKNLLDDNSVLVSGNDHYVDLCMMSLCNAHIIANSSFSWWAATLGNVNSVIAPKEWFGPKGPKNWDSIYFENWIKI